MPTAKLTPEQTADARRAAQDLNDVAPDLQMLEQCGVDCQELRASVERRRDQLNNLVQFFGSE